MKHIYCSLVLTFVLHSESVFSEEPTKIHDKVRGEVVELCSKNPDGTYTVAIRCKYDWLDMPFIAYRADQKQIRKPSEVSEIITPIHSRRSKDSVYAIFQKALVEVKYSTIDGRSSIFVYQPSDETPHKFSSGSGWLVDTSALATEVNEVDGFKKGDTFCLKQSPEGYPNGLPVKIARLFSKVPYAVVDTVNEGFLGMGNTFSGHFTNRSNLIACEKPSLDPAKAVNTSAPIVQEDVKIFNQQTPKEVVAPAASSTEQNEAGTSK